MLSLTFKALIFSKTHLIELMLKYGCFKVWMLSAFILGVSACTKHHDAPEPPVLPPPVDTIPTVPIKPDTVKDVFMVGTEYEMSTQRDYGTFWHNGEASRLPGGVSSMPTAIALDGEDLYITGAIELQNGDARAVIWKNGQLIPLVDTTDTEGEFRNPSVATDITIHDHKVYVVGMMTSTDLEQYAALWVEGKSEKLDEGPEGGAAQSIGFTTSGDMYIMGAVIQDHYVIPSLWKNGVRSTLDYAITAFDMAVNGEDIYIVCSYNSDSYYGLPCVVKNGALYAPLNDFRVANKMAVTDTGVYVAGQTYIDWAALSWQNGQTIRLPGFTANDIAVNGDDVYVVGNFMDGALQYGRLWKNGIAQPLSDSLAYSNIISIALRK